jgi:antirestriction protein ArdC
MQKVDVYQIITDRLIDIMEQGIIPWRKPWNTGREGGPLNLVSKKHYQGINVFLLLDIGRQIRTPNYAAFPICSS